MPRRRVRWLGIGVLAFGFAIGSAAAQTVPSSLQPGHSSQQFSPKIAPLSRPAGQLVDLTPNMAPAEASKITLRVKSVTVEGSTVYGKVPVEALFADMIGKVVTAADIYALANRLGAKYGQDGYLVARVVVVPQAVDQKAAAIRLQVVEGYIERVDWPASAARYESLLAPCFDKIRGEHPARTKTIERCLLLANDLPGLTVSSSLKAGTANDGASALVVAVTEKPFEVTETVDNRVAQGRGPAETTTTLTENNRLGLMEAATLTYAQAFDMRTSQYVAADWKQVLNGDGLTFDLNGSYSTGVPDLAALNAIDFSGTSWTLEGSLTYPVIRTREQNLRLSLLGFAEDAENHELGALSTDDRLRGLRFRANYDQVDTWLGSVGQSQIIGTVSHGFDGLGSTDNGNALASVASGSVDFTKVEVSANRTQALVDRLSLYGAVDAQWSPTALLSAEQCVYGGAGIGRASDPSALAGDQCISELGEVRYDLPITGGALTKAQIYAFADHGDLWRVDPAASTADKVSGSSLGAGVRLGWKDNFSADLQAADGFGDSAQGWRGFLSVSAHY